MSLVAIAALALSALLGGAGATPAPSPAVKASPTAKPDKCALHVAQFALAQRGASGHVDRFVVSLLLTGREPVRADLQIPGLENDILTPVIGPDAGGAQTLVHYMIDVPRALGPAGMKVFWDVPGGSQNAVMCSSPVTVLDPNAPTPGQFDDTALSGSDLFFPRPVTEARVLRPVAAAYPSDEYKLKHEGVAVVALMVGAGGDVLAARIQQSTGYPALDRSALAAAKSTGFSQPEFDGLPVPLEYLVTYRFSLHS